MGIEFKQLTPIISVKKDIIDIFFIMYRGSLYPKRNTDVLICKQNAEKPEYLDIFLEALIHRPNPTI